MDVNNFFLCFVGNHKLAGFAWLNFCVSIYTLHFFLFYSSLVEKKSQKFIYLSIFPLFFLLKQIAFNLNKQCDCYNSFIIILSKIHSIYINTTLLCVEINLLVEMKKKKIREIFFPFKNIINIHR